MCIVYIILTFFFFRYLYVFEDFYRKLGSIMGIISRFGRSRNNFGRGMGVYKS